MKKYMVYDTQSEDVIFHETLEEAEKDYNNHVNDLLDGEEIYIFEVRKSSGVKTASKPVNHEIKQVEFYTLEDIKRLKYENTQLKQFMIEISSGGNLGKAIYDNKWMTEADYYKLLAQQALLAVSHDIDFGVDKK